MNASTIYENGNYLDKNPTWHEEDSFWKAEKIIKLLSRNNISPTTFCEVGCGAGGILACLADGLGPEARLSGYEISPQAFELCKRKERNNIDFYLSNLLAEESVAFDVVAAIDVFEHVEDYFSFLRKLREKGEYKIFHIPLDLSVQTVLRSSPLLRARALVGHIHYFTKETALAVLEDTGYEIVDYFYTGGSLDLPGRGWKADLLKFPRKWLFSINEDFTVRLLGGYSLMVLAR